MRSLFTNRWKIRYYDKAEEASMLAMENHTMQLSLNRLSRTNSTKTEIILYLVYGLIFAIIIIYLFKTNGTKFRID